MRTRSGLPPAVRARRMAWRLSRRTKEDWAITLRIGSPRGGIEPFSHPRREPGTKLGKYAKRRAKPRSRAQLPGPFRRSLGWVWKGESVATIRASCPTCGDVELTSADVQVLVCTTTNEGSYAFRCPACRLAVAQP